MKKVKFGVAQISNPTPRFAKTIFRVVLYTAAVINLLLFFIPDIPANVKLKVLEYCGIVTPLAHAISKLFGIDISDIEQQTKFNNQT